MSEPWTSVIDFIKCFLLGVVGIGVYVLICAWSEYWISIIVITIFGALVGHCTGIIR